MIVDSSALVAILNDEPEAEPFSEAIQSAARARMSAANFLEAAIVADSQRNPVASRHFDDLLAKFEIQIEPVTESQVRIARAAYRDFGKGSRHKANLNFGDCFAYALALTTGEPLLFKGNDFNHTGIVSAVTKRTSK